MSRHWSLDLARQLQVRASWLRRLANVVRGWGDRVDRRVTLAGAMRYQTGGRTAPDRYPDLFAALRDQMDTMAAPRIVSFGCSTGEETVTLRRYLPAARIIGVDIDRRRIGVARARIREPGISFHRAARLADLDLGQVDAITCLSVMHRRALLHEWPTDCRPHMTFADFDRAMGDLDRHLAVGGFLLFYHSSFSFLDTGMAERYTPLYLVAPQDHARDKRYDRHDRPVLLSRQQRFALFRKDRGA